ncbi:hypothetical protein [Candidatus Velamenicoccus archaeovorus]|nr:hypothetical protein [Candidatus Velamenicoccus archaeovorus]
MKMRNKTALFFRYRHGLLLFAAGCLVFVFALTDAAQAQSAAEYSALTEAVAAAAAAKKEKPEGTGAEKRAGRESPTAADAAGEAVTKAYGEDGEAFSAKGDTLLKQLGGTPQADASAESSPRTAEPRMIEFEDRDGPAAGGGGKNGEAEIPAGQGIRVYLKDGHVVEGKLLEEADGRCQVQTGGVSLTYFKDEIQKTEKF